MPRAAVSCVFAAAARARGSGSLRSARRARASLASSSSSSSSSSNEAPPVDPYLEQKKHRLSWMHWLHDIPKHRAWAASWQRDVQDRLRATETVRLGVDCFIAEDAHIFAEPGRDVVVGDRCKIASHVYVHGPVVLGNDVSINARW